MADIFYAKDLNNLFKGKSVLFLGDSIMRYVMKNSISTYI